MSEELQAVLDENRGGEIVENQGIEAQQNEANDSQVDSATTETDEPKTNNVEKRINKLTAEKFAEKRRAEALEEENRRLKESREVDSSQESQGKPTLEQFDYDESKYTEALIS
jgi:predicted RNase H-like nuclease (RuvC/YqgF family)